MFLSLITKNDYSLSSFNDPAKSPSYGGSVKYDDWAKPIVRIIATIYLCQYFCTGISTIYIYDVYLEF